MLLQLVADVFLGGTLDPVGLGARRLARPAPGGGAILGHGLLDGALHAQVDRLDDHLGRVGRDVVVQKLQDARLILTHVDGVLVAQGRGTSQVLQADPVPTELLHLLVIEVVVNLLGTEGLLHQTGEVGQTLRELLTDLIIAEVLFHLLMIQLVLHRLEQVQQSAMRARKLINDLLDRLNHSLEVVLVETLERLIGAHGLVQVPKQPLVVVDVAITLLDHDRLPVLIQAASRKRQLAIAVNPSDSLEKVVLRQRFTDVKRRVAVAVEAREQLGDYDDNIRATLPLEGLHDVTVVSRFVTILFHHLLPEDLDDVASIGDAVLLDLVPAIAGIRTGNDDLGLDLPQVVEDLLHADSRRLARGDHLPLETATLPDTEEVLGDIACLRVDGRAGLA